MEKKQRVPEGEKYWLIRIDVNGVKVYCHEEGSWESDKRYFEDGNYFHTKEEAESTARKLRAVLMGAEVIEMPSEEEIKASQDKIEDEVVFNIRDNNGAQLIYCTAINKGAELMADWLKTKCIR